MFSDVLKRPLPSQMNPNLVDDADIDDMESQIGAEPNDDDDTIDPELEKEVDQVELTPEEEREADRCIDLAATPVMLKEVLGDKEVQEFVISDDFEVGCLEGFLTESFRDEALKDSFFAEAGKIYNKTKVQLDKKARFAQLFEISVLGCARAKNDPDYIKLQKVLKMRRVLKKRLRQKYRNPALKRAKFYLQRLRKSGSGILSKVAKTISK